MYAYTKWSAVVSITFYYVSLILGQLLIMNLFLATFLNNFMKLIQI